MITKKVVISQEELGQIASEIATAPVVAIDTETTSLSPFKGEIRIFSINTGKQVYVVDLFKTKTLGPVKEALETSPCVKVLQNAKFDQKWLLYKYGLELWPMFDTFRASALIHNGHKMSHSLYDLYSRELNIKPEIADHSTSDWSAPELSDEQYTYAAEDVTHLPALRDSLIRQLIAKGLTTVAAIEFGAILPEVAVELNGIYLDRDAWGALAEQKQALAIKLRAALVQNLPNPLNQCVLPGFQSDFNLDSPTQMLASLQMLGLKNLENTREITLTMHASKYKVIEELLKYREVSKTLSSFGVEFLKHINAKTGRVHGEYYAMLATGRYSMSSPNLQQIPRGKDYRKCFRAPPGKRIVLADYSNIEMCLAAEISGDKNLIENFQLGRDAHKFTAAFMSGVPYDSVSKDERQKSKCFNFGLIYGMKPEKLILYAMANYQVALSKSEAEEKWAKWFELYPGVQRWHQRQIAEGQKAGMAKTIAGRIRYLDPEKSYNEFLNSPVQGSGADGLKAALRSVYFRMKKHSDWNGRVKMVHMVHDEIVLEVDDDPELLQQVKADLETGMIEGMAQFMKKVPVKVEGSIGASWADKA
jgi:DNA polymerase I